MAFINNNFIQDLLNQADIVSIINKRVPLKKAGKDYKACCPFHEEKTPSFSVSQQKGIYYCFGCGAGGDVIKFVRQYHNISFIEAVEVIAEQLAMPVVYDKTNQTNKENETFKQHLALMAKVCVFYQSQLKTHASAKKAIHYQQERGLSADIIERFSLGFAPPGWQNLYNAFKNSAADIKALQVLGLLVEKNNQYYDRFRDRLMFPIHNRRGDVIAFGGRLFKADEKAAKYLNSPESMIFHKNLELYGLYQAKKYHQKTDALLVVEGYFDVIGLHQVGINNVVATMGTAISKQQLTTLIQNQNKIIFCFDGDKAGEKAAWRALEVALPLIKPGVFIHFLQLPSGEDPDSFVKKHGKQDFLTKAKKAQTLSTFLFKPLSDDESVETRTLTISKITGLMAIITNAVYKQQLSVKLAELTQQNQQQINSLLTNNHKENKQTAQIKQTKKRQQTNKPLTRAIELVLNFPEITKNIDLAKIKDIGDATLFRLVSYGQQQKKVSTANLLALFEEKKQHPRLMELTKIIGCENSEKAQEELSEVVFKLQKENNNKNITQLKNKQNKTDSEKKALAEAIRNKRYHSPTP